MGDARHLSSEILDLLLLQSLPEAEASSARAHLDACPDCRAQVQERQADHAHFQQHVFPRTVARVEARARSPWERFRTPWTLAVPAVALALLALVIVRASPGDDPYIGVKGGPRLQIVALRGQSQFAVAEGARLHPGDRIRFQVDPGQAHHLLIASKDGAGHASVYFSGAVTGGGLQDLPGSIELDSALGPEHLHALFSDEPLDPQPILRALESSAPLPRTSAALTRTFIKEAP